MPRGPQGERRPADVIGAAITVAKIATGEIKEGPGATEKKKVKKSAAKRKKTSPTRDRHSSML
jgi:hypothetical protein